MLLLFESKIELLSLFSVIVIVILKKYLNFRHLRPNFRARKRMSAADPTFYKTNYCNVQNQS